MIIFIWRNIAKELPSNEANIKSLLNFNNDYGSLGFASSPDYFEVDGGLRKVYANDWGSGVTIRDYVANGHQQEFRITVHELAHYLLALGNEYHNGFGFWGMLSAWGIRSIVPNSFERNRLGWINNLQTISSSTTQTIPNVQLGDYISTVSAIAMEINSSAGEYFYIENHQATSYWETTFAFGNIEPGIYVIRKVGAPNQYNPSWFQLIAADGRYNWTVNQSSTLPGGTDLLPVFKQGLPNKDSGYHDNQWVPFSYGGLTSPAPIHFTEQYGYPVQDIRFLGDGKDAFRVGYNQVFSPWSNPNNQRVANQTAPFGFEITNFSSGVFTLNIYVNTSQDASPSKVQNLRLTGADPNHPSLAWDLNTETDISSYTIYRSFDNSSFLNLDRTVVHPTNTFIDYTVNYTKPIWEKSVKYYVVAVDNTSLSSVPSNQVETSGIVGPLPTINTNNFAITQAGEDGINNFGLFSNYPNPFNPTTKISFSLPQKSQIKLKIFDILCREVANLADGVYEAGKYEVEFNALSLPSGVYFYNLTTASGSISKKMLLVK